MKWAVAEDLPGVSFWKLEGANASQLKAIKEFNWPGIDPPPDDTPSPGQIIFQGEVEAGELTLRLKGN